MKNQVHKITYWHLIKSVLLLMLFSLFNQTAWTQTYCQPQRAVQGNGNYRVDVISIVSLVGTSGSNSLNNTSHGSMANSYNNFTFGHNIPTMYPGSNYLMTVKGGGNGSHVAVVWIDFENAGDNGFVYVGSNVVNNPNANYTGNLTINIPNNIPLGTHRMRVLWQYNIQGNSYYNDKPCTNDDWGQTEDYLIEIIGCPPVQPNCPTLTYPANNQTGITRCGTTLTWNKPNNIDCTQDLEYDIYLGTTTNPLFFATVSENYYSPVLNGNTTYYWRVVAKNAEGTLNNEIGASI